MNTDKLSLMLAQRDILRYCGNVDIEESLSELYDILVCEKTQGLKFGVNVVSSSFETNVSFGCYLDKLLHADLYASPNNIPLVVMAVNTNTNKSHFGIVVTWNREKPVVYQRISMRESSERNWGLALDHILSMNDAISMLSQYGINILKRIEVEKQHYDGSICFGEILYMRSFSNVYKMKQKEIKSDKERFDRLVYGIPEDEYPSDDLDLLILNAIRDSDWKIRKVRDNEVNSSSFLFTTDMKELQVYREKSTFHFTVVNKPSFEGIPNNHLPNYNGLDVFYVYMTGYSTTPHDAEAFNTGALYVEDSLDGWREKTQSYINLRETLHPISDYFE